MNISAKYWLAAPAGTPEAVIQFLAEAFRKGCSDKAYKEGMDKLGISGVWRSPADATKSMEEMENLFLKIIKKYDLKPQ
jgi:tripartite-type tricarboxylate transporter receptor subunit TctC